MQRAPAFMEIRVCACTLSLWRALSHAATQRHNNYKECVFECCGVKIYLPCVPHRQCEHAHTPNDIYSARGKCVCVFVLCVVEHLSISRTRVKYTRTYTHTITAEPLHTYVHHASYFVRKSHESVLGLPYMMPFRVAPA